MDRQLHIVSFDVPWPANYGGVIDVFHKVRALHNAGVNIILHCFEYGDRKRDIELDKYCETVHYYRRTTGIVGVSLLRPYIVNSRKAPLLLKNLLATEAPILFEGLHTCYYLNHPSLKDRIKFVRTHNIEHDYYKGLAEVEKKWWKRGYFKFEAKLLEQYEVILKEANGLFAISDSDKEHFAKLNTAHCVAAFHGNDVVYSQLGDGEYCLYHGNLAVAENEKAAIELVENVFSKLKGATKIAGANPTKELQEAVAEYEHVELISNPTEEQMMQLKREAHVHVLYSGQATGIKLKLIDSLCQGRFVIANDNILLDDTFNTTARRANEWVEYMDAIEDVFLDTFTIEAKAIREAIVQSTFSNKENAEKIIDTIFL